MGRLLGEEFLSNLCGTLCQSGERTDHMPQLTSDQISALARRGANRWQKKGMDRIYLNVEALGYHVERDEDGRPRTYLGNEELDLEYVGIALETKVWIDVPTGEVGTRLPMGMFPPNSKRDEGTENRILSYYEQSAKAFLADACEKAEWEAADLRARSLSSAAMKWGKGTVVSIDGHEFTIGRTASLRRPSEDKAAMLGKVRLIVRMFDGTYRRFELVEGPEDKEDVSSGG